jgi:hypothetical protein
MSIWHGGRWVWLLSSELLFELLQMEFFPEGKEKIKWATLAKCRKNLPFKIPG